jgi:hypothetical protein
MGALFSDYEDIKKSGLFDAEYYLATYPDVAERNVDPLVHYLEEGARAGRNPQTGETIMISAKPKRTVVKALALKALKEGEEHGLKDYQEALDDIDLSSSDLVSNQLIPAQQRHINLLDQLINSVGRA